MSDLERVWNEPGLDPARDRSACPSRDELSDLASGRLAAERREELVDHLVECGNCAAETQLLQRLSRWAEQADEVVAAASGPRSAAAPPRGSRWAWPAAAAAAVVAVVCAAGWQSALRTSPGGAYHANVPVVDLLPAGALRAAQQGSQVEIVAPGGEVPLVLVLDAAAASGDLFAVEVVREGRSLARLERLERAPFGNLTLALPASQLRPGRYELRLTSRTGEVERTVGVYSFTLLDRP